jgi:D-3-phosphoglycerate dehydrogenase
MIKVLSIDKTHEVLEQNLRVAGFDLVIKEDYERIDLLNNIAYYDCLIVRSKVEIDKEIIDRGKRLKAIARVGAGMDAIDVQYAESKGIKCLNSPEGNKDAVGEHCLGLLLCLFNKINISDREIRQGLWQREANRGLEIKNKTIGIMGYGNMGMAFAQRLLGFECEILAYDKYKKGFGNNRVKEVSLETLLEKVDVLSLHVPLTEETRFMIDSNFINRLKKSFYLLNTSRGKVVKIADLVCAMQKGKVLGAGLDVLEFENFSNEFFTYSNLPDEIRLLFNFPNTVLTPHVAGWSVESNYKLANILSQKIISALS